MNPGVGAWIQQPNLRTFIDEPLTRTVYFTENGNDKFGQVAANSEKSNFISSNPVEFFLNFGEDGDKDEKFEEVIHKRRLQLNRSRSRQFDY